jgi:glycerol-3-phosphate dehydrogenase
VKIILATYNRYFPEHPCSKSDILEYYCGIRVLPQYSDAAFSASRSAMLVCDNEDKPSYIAIYGGKLTTYRKEAEKVERLISRRLPAKQKADTDKISLT